MRRFKDYKIGKKAPQRLGDLLKVKLICNRMEKKIMSKKKEPCSES
jgi:hypothetical protein